MSRKVSVRRVQQRATAENRRALDRATRDSFQNFMLGLGIGTQNPTTANFYGFNPKTRERTELEWAYRGSFVAGVAIDVIADDMTREGVDLVGDLRPEQIEKIDERATTLKIWPKLNQGIKWGRLYGGSVVVLLIDGQDYSKPLRIDTVGPDQFKGLLVLDRWNVSPTLNDLVTDIGPDLGMPKFYTVEYSAPALRGVKIHHSRCLRLIGDELPYQQAIIEQMWGASVLERPFDRMSGFDAATTGASQQVHKSYLRYFKVDKYRDILGGTGGPQALKGLMEMIAHMRMFASNEGITVIDSKDDMVTAQASTFTGIADVLLQLGQQLSGTFQIPLVRLFGQSPAGLSATGESDLKTYYDGIRKRQVQDMLVMVTVIYRLIAQSLKFKVGDGFGITFRSLWQMTETEKAEIAQKDTSTVMEVHSAGLISDQVALRELQFSARRTGRWKAITDEIVEAASDEVAPPGENVVEPPPSQEYSQQSDPTVDNANQKAA
jgi:phage-related protein (TIGR01555 family)